MKSPNVSDEAVQNATGKPWETWFDLLHEMNAADLDHKEIAARLQEEHEVSGWWAQSITVEFERSIGRRAVGQVSDGSYQTAASRTLAGTMDDVLAAWQNLVELQQDFDGVSFANEPDISITDNWRYWRVNLRDESKVTVTIGQKSPNKAQLAVNHEKLPDSEAINRWKAYWTTYLLQLEK